jgi:hypothetical protein
VYTLAIVRLNSADSHTLTLNQRCLINALAPPNVDEDSCALHGSYGCCINQLVGVWSVGGAAAAGATWNFAFLWVQRALQGCWHATS